MLNLVLAEAANLSCISDQSLRIPSPEVETADGKYCSNRMTLKLRSAVLQGLAQVATLSSTFILLHVARQIRTMYKEVSDSTIGDSERLVRYGSKS